MELREPFPTVKAGVGTGVLAYQQLLMMPLVSRRFLSI